MLKPKYKIGDVVIATGLVYQSANGTLFAGEVDKEIGEIKKIASLGAHPYKIEGIDGWLNERNLKKYIVPEVHIGDRVRLIRNETYGKTIIRHSPNLIYILEDIDIDAATIRAENDNNKKLLVNVYNLKKV